MATGRIGTNTVLTTRWSKAPTGGTTSLSGLDDNSVSLVYSVGYEQVYRNGVLLSRGNDYTATNGTTITLIDATITGDIIEVFANATIPLTDTYSQTVANGKFINNTLTTTTGDIIYASAANTPARLGIGSTDQVLKVSGGVPAWGAAPGGTWTQAATGSLSGSSVVISGLSGKQYYLYLEGWSHNSGTAEYVCIRVNGDTGNNYRSYDSNVAYSNFYLSGTATLANTQTRSAGGHFDMCDTSMARKPFLGMNVASADGSNSGWYVSSSAITSITIFPSGGSFDAGTYYVWSFA